MSRLSQELPARGGWYHATRSHAKLLLFALSDGRHFTVETSGNMRTCRSIEQFVLTHDQELFEFHARWMEAARAREVS